MESFILQTPIEYFPCVRCRDGHHTLRPNSDAGEEREGVCSSLESGKEASATSGLRGKARKIFPGVGD